jgi:hypothetical protein
MPYKLRCKTCNQPIVLITKRTLRRLDESYLGDFIHARKCNKQGVRFFGCFVNATTKQREAHPEWQSFYAKPKEDSNVQSSK